MYPFLLRGTSVTSYCLNLLVVRTPIIRDEVVCRRQDSVIAVLHGCVRVESRRDTLSIRSHVLSLGSEEIMPLVDDVRSMTRSTTPRFLFVLSVLTLILVSPSLFVVSSFILIKSITFYDIPFILSIMFPTRSLGEGLLRYRLDSEFINLPQVVF